MMEWQGVLHFSCSLNYAKSTPPAFRQPKKPCTKLPPAHPTTKPTAGESASTGLTEALVALGFETDRLKTGTPARVDARTIDFSGLEEQPGEEGLWHPLLAAALAAVFDWGRAHAQRLVTCPHRVWVAHSHLPHTPASRGRGGAVVQL